METLSLAKSSMKTLTVKPAETPDGSRSYSAVLEFEFEAPGEWMRERGLDDIDDLKRCVFRRPDEKADVRIGSDLALDGVTVRQWIVESDGTGSIKVHVPHETAHAAAEWAIDRGALWRGSLEINPAQGVLEFREGGKAA